MIAFAGKGAKAATHNQWHTRQGGLGLVSLYFEASAVQAVHAHVQLGTVIDDHGTMYPEL